MTVPKIQLCYSFLNHVLVLYALHARKGPGRRPLDAIKTVRVTMERHPRERRLT